MAMAGSPFRAGQGPMLAHYIDHRGARIEIDGIQSPVDREIDAFCLKTRGLRLGLARRVWRRERQCRSAGRLEEAAAGCHGLKLEPIVHCHTSACARVCLELTPGIN